MTDSFSGRPQQLVIISSIDWSAAWQRHQIFAAQFARAGCEVFFIENSGFRNPAWTDLGRVAKKAGDWLLPDKTGARTPDGTRVFGPRVLPPTFKAFRLANRYALLPRLMARLRAAGLRPGATVIAYFPTSTSLDLLSMLEPACVVYDCASNFRAHPAAPRDFGELERDLLRLSDLVVCDSDFLYRQKKAEHPNVIQIHQGVSESFLKVKPGRGQVRSFCYYGTWGPDLVPAYLEALLGAGFDVTVSGFFKGRHAPLPRGVTLLAPTTPERLPERLESFDAFLMPYRVTPFHLGVVPAKIYECLAMGRPVLATPLPSLEPYRCLIHIAERPEDWARLARDLPRTENENVRESRRALAAEHTHAKEFERLRSAIDAARAKRFAARTPPSLPGGVRAFVSGFSWIGLFYGAAKVSILATQVLAGRLLGPGEFGQANLVLAISAFLQILPTMGFPVALAKFLSPAMPEAERRKTISTAMSAFAAWSALLVCLCWAFRSRLSSALSVPEGLFLLALLYSLANAAYVVVSSPLLGLQLFRLRGISEALYGLGAPVFFLLLAGRAGAGSGPSYADLVHGLTAGFVVAALHSLWRLRPYLRPLFDRPAFRGISRYAAMAALNLLTVACVLAPARLVLNRSFSAHEVGVFSAYFTATAQVSLSILYMVAAVLIPVSSDTAGQEQAWSVFRRIRMPLALGAWGGLALAAAAALCLFGRQYEFRWDWAMGFSAAAALILVHGIAANIYAARDLAGLRVSVAGSVAAGGANLALCVLLIPRWGISGAAAALFISYALGLATYALLGGPGTFRDRAIL